MTCSDLSLRAEDYSIKRQSADYITPNIAPIKPSSDAPIKASSEGVFAAPIQNPIPQFSKDFEKPKETKTEPKKRLISQSSEDNGFAVPIPHPMPSIRQTSDSTAEMVKHTSPARVPYSPGESISSGTVRDRVGKR